MPPSQQFVAMARLAGLQDWAAARGVPVAKSSQCLSNEKSVDQLVQMNSDASNQFPDFPGTPTFVINGKMVRDTGTWDKLEPALKSALAG
jgi:protein-disulfide isomerase